MKFPEYIPNWINGREVPAISGATFPKLNPATGDLLCTVARAETADVDKAVQVSRNAQLSWAELPPVKRGEILHAVASALKANREEVAEVVHFETGKSKKDALGETDGAAALGFFMAGEGQRLYGRTTTSGIPNRCVMTIRQPLGVAGLIVAANTPIANVAWKVFPALICGNAAVLKPSEDAPSTAWIFAKIAHEAGIPAGVLNVIQGLGEEAGAPIVSRADVISFTGSTDVGRQIAVTAGERLARVSLELGGKNPLVVCDDADLDNAAKWVLLSAFSNAGQRCAAAGRIIVFESIYRQFRDMLVERTSKLKIGPRDDDDFGPVINERQLINMIRTVEKARDDGARILIGGCRLKGTYHRNGFYMEPTLIENVTPSDEISNKELFGPIACLYQVKTLADALALANHSHYGLTACIHTKNIHRSMEFCQKVQAGVAVVNAGTYGSEPHLPFGGFKQSGNGTREPGTEALDIYSELKNIYINTDPSQV